MSADEPRYHLLRAALSLLQKPLAELSDQEFSMVERQARREQAIEKKVLSSVEGAAVIIPSALVESAVMEIGARFADEESFRAALYASRLDREALYQAIERDLRVQAVIERITARGWRADETDAEIFYHMHRQRFVVPESRTLRHILITVNDSYHENTRAQALQRICEIRKRLEKKPKCFEEMALKHSECPTALHGGLLGQVGRGQLYPELETAAFDLPAGGISLPVESSLGWHLLYCEAISPQRMLAFSEVAHKIKAQLQQRYDRIWLREWLK
ncbi:MAG: nitrogen fixation protein NifM [Pseudomonadota bacterium]